MLVAGGRIDCLLEITRPLSPLTPNFLSPIHTRLLINLLFCGKTGFLRLHLWKLVEQTGGTGIQIWVRPKPKPLLSMLIHSQ